MLLLIILIFYLINIYSLNEIFTNNNEELLVLTYDNTNDIKKSHTENLLNLLNKNNIKNNVIGIGKEWTGWYGRTQEYKEFINNLSDDNMYVVICDGRDVLLNNSNSNEIINKAKQLCDIENKIIFGAEKFCCAGIDDKINRVENMDINIPIIDIYSELLKNIVSNNYPDYKNDYFFLNYGQIFGKVKNLKYFYNSLNLVPDMNDQGLAYKFLYDNQDKVFLDNKQELFTNISNGNCPIQFDDNKNKFKQTDTNTYPSFIHCPGGNWECYKNIVNKLLGTEGIINI